MEYILLPISGCSTYWMKLIPRKLRCLSLCLFHLWVKLVTGSHGVPKKKGRETNGACYGGCLFPLSVDGSVPGMHVAVSTMKKGEKSRFIFRPEYYYGELGCAPRIPPNCTGWCTSVEHNYNNVHLSCAHQRPEFSHDIY